MTVLLTTCPFCNSNFMLLDAETGNANCITCSKTKKMSPEELSEAESRRDTLSETYVSRMEEAYSRKDYGAMKTIADEVVNEGISSWYAWFCIGWSDMHEGNTGPAFDDFRLAVLFLDEENFDEFYELVMETVLDSLEECAREGKTWNTDDTTMVEFTGTLMERFEHLMADGDFMADLMLRVGTLSDDITKASEGAELINESMMIVLDYMAGNTFIPDHQALLENTLSALDSLDSALKAYENDGTVPKQAIQTVGTGYSDFVQRLIDIGSRAEAEYSEEELYSLCEYWSMNDYESVYDIFLAAFESHVKFMSSSGRNKGALKKRDKALADYENAFMRPLRDGLIGSDVEEDTDSDRICPECGNMLNADEHGLMVCECGFRGRTVTDRINELPEDIPGIIREAEKALAEMDSETLNNAGEKILSIEGSDWHGDFYIAMSCLKDGQLAEAIMLLSQAFASIPKKDSKAFVDTVVDKLGKALSESDDTEDFTAFLMLATLFIGINDSQAFDPDFAMRIIDRMSEGEYSRSCRAYSALFVVDSAMMYSFRANTSLAYQKESCCRFKTFMDSISKGMNSIKKDHDGLKDNVVSTVKTYSDLFGYLSGKIDSRLSAMSDEERGRLEGYWQADKDAYEDLLEGLAKAFLTDDDAVYKRDSNSMKKSRHMIDVYLDAYVKAGKD